MMSAKAGAGCRVAGAEIASVLLSMPLNSYRELIVWQRAMELLSEIYRLVEALPAHEAFGLASQLRRSAVSIPANIAEGYGRAGRREYLHHLSVANGSLRELETLLLATLRAGLLSESSLRRGLLLADQVGALLTKLRRLAAPIS